MRWLVAALLVACSSPSAPAPSPGVPPSSRPIESTPARVVDSHVHLAYYPVADHLGENGVDAVVDLASPELALGTKYPILVIQSGPMLTRPGGYPLNAWGSDGYGIGCETNACVTSTIDRLKSKGAGVVKLALDEGGLDVALAMHATLEAHRRNMKVVAHALTNASAQAAGMFGADALAHTPLEPLTEETIAAWRVIPEPKKSDEIRMQPDRRGRAVITTLAAFGGSAIALDNLRKLRAAGVTVLYGTDLGNLRIDGISSDEIKLMKSAGMTEEEIGASMTIAPWVFWGFDMMRPVPGKPAGE